MIKSEWLCIVTVFPVEMKVDIKSYINHLLAVESLCGCEPKVHWRLHGQLASTDLYHVRSQVFSLTNRTPSDGKTKLEPGTGVDGEEGEML